MPDTLPCSIFAMLSERFSTIPSVLISCIAYPSAFFSRLIPKAVTTTSSNDLVSSNKTTFKYVRPLREISWGLNPKYENSITAFAFGIAKLNSPSTSVTVECTIVASGILTITFTPIKDSPFEFSTFPLTCICASILALHKNSRRI